MRKTIIIMSRDGYFLEARDGNTFNLFVSAVPIEQINPRFGTDPYMDASLVDEKIKSTFVEIPLEENKVSFRVTTAEMKEAGPLDGITAVWLEFNGQVVAISPNVARRIAVELATNADTADQKNKN